MRVVVIEDSSRFTGFRYVDRACRWLPKYFEMFHPFFDTTTNHALKYDSYICLCLTTGSVYKTTLFSVEMSFKTTVLKMISTHIMFCRRRKSSLWKITLVWGTFTSRLARKRNKRVLPFSVLSQWKHIRRLLSAFPSWRISTIYSTLCFTGGGLLPKNSSKLCCFSNLHQVFIVGSVSFSAFSASSVILLTDFISFPVAVFSLSGGHDQGY